MKFFINNNTTYNYSYYATRPKWLVEALLKEPLSPWSLPSRCLVKTQRKFETNFSCSKKSFPNNKIAFVPWPQKLKSQKSKIKDFQAISILQTQTKNHIIAPQKLKSKVLATDSIEIKKSPKKVYRRCLFQTKELLCWTSDLSFFNLRGYFSNILKVLQICRFTVRNNQKILFIKGSCSSYDQEKMLSPWLVQYRRNAVPAKLNSLFNRSYLDWVKQLLSPQVLYLKKNKENNQGKNNFYRITNYTAKHSLSQQDNSKAELVSYSFAKNSLKNLLGKHSNRLKKTTAFYLKVRGESPKENPAAYYRRYYQLNSLLNNCLNLTFEKTCNNKASHFKNPFLFIPHFKNQKILSKLWRPAFFPSELLSNKKGKQNKMLFFVDPYLKGLNYVPQDQSLKNQNEYKQRQKAIIPIDNIIKLWIKEAQTMSQQTAAGLTIPLAGFLTNSKTTFNAIYNLSNDDFYSSISSNFKSNNLLNTSSWKIKISRLEKIGFQKSCNQLTSTLPKHGQDKESRIPTFDPIALPFTTTRAKSKNGLKTENFVETPKYKISQKQTGKGRGDGLGALAFSFPKVFESWKLAATKKIKKGKKKKIIQYKDSDVSIAFPLKNQRAQDFGFSQGWWTDYSNSQNYLALVSNTRANFLFNLLSKEKRQKKNESIIFNEKIKKPRSLEYCCFGDILTWQSKSQKSPSMFHLSTPFSKSKENVIFYLKKQVLLEKREPIIFKKKKPPFFTHFKKQLKKFKNQKLQFKEPLKCLNHNPWQRQTNNSFLKKRQFLSTLAKFIIFYLNGGGILFKNPTKQVKKKQTYIDLPSFSTIKTQVKISVNSRNFGKYGYKPVYGYTFAFCVLERIFNQQDEIKRFQSLTIESKVNIEGSQSRESLFFRTSTQLKASTQRGQKSKKWSQKKLRLRPLLFYKYYKTVIALNNFNQYKMFAKTPFINNRVADIIFFINPEKNQNLVNQANSLKIPTVGIVSGNMPSVEGHQEHNYFHFKDSVYYPILGNPISSFFSRAIISLIVKFLRVEKSKNK